MKDDEFDNFVRIDREEFDRLERKSMITTIILAMLGCLFGCALSYLVSFLIK